MSLARLNQAHFRQLKEYRPRLRAQQSLMKAAVSMILRDGPQGAEVLLMQRAFYPKDPWSGQMAFPGGKIEADDASAKAAAMREAHEEVGVELFEHDYIGRLDDLYGLKVNNVFSVHISCFIFKPERNLSLQGNEEVADMVWLPLANLSDASFAHDFVHPSEPSLTMPAVMINAEKDQILWGLSLRILSNLHSVLGVEMSVLNEYERSLLRDIEKRELSDRARESIERDLARAQAR